MGKITRMKVSNKCGVDFKAGGEWYHFMPGVFDVPHEFITPLGKVVQVHGNGQLELFLRLVDIDVSVEAFLDRVRRKLARKVSLSLRQWIQAFGVVEGAWLWLKSRVRSFKVMLGIEEK